MLRTLFILSAVFSGLVHAQKFDFKDMNKQKLKEIDQRNNGALLLKLDKQDKIKIIGAPENLKSHKDSLKSYIFQEKEKAIIRLDKTQENYSFEKYKKCLFQVGKIYEEVWNEIAQKKHQKKFDDCSTNEKEVITAEYPLMFR